MASLNSTMFEDPDDEDNMEFSILFLTDAFDRSTFVTKLVPFSAS